MHIDKVGHAKTCLAAYRVGEIFGRDVELCGEIAHAAPPFADARRQQIHKAPDDIRRTVGRAHCVVARGMELEQIVHHRKGSRSDRLFVKQTPALSQTPPYIAQVGFEACRPVDGKADDGIVEKSDAATYTEVVGRQLRFEKAVRGHECERPEIGRYGEVGDQQRRTDNRRVIALYGESTSRITELHVPGKTQNVHAASGQLAEANPSYILGIC